MKIHLATAFPTSHRRSNPAPNEFISGSLMSPKRLNSCQVAVIGAGPYGLSVAAHLKQANISTRVFGEPMGFWQHHMPKGMMLRSPWRATHLSSPDDHASLDAYATERGVPTDRPLRLQDFVAYGKWFRERAVPDVDRGMVRLVEATSNGFRVTLADGAVFAADRVVVATGLAGQDYRPPALRDLPAALVTHACDHDDFAPFHGKRVAVIGRGQSACESAVLLAEAGAETELISRGDVHWLGNGTHKSPIWRLHETLASPSAVGPFPLGWLAELPSLVWHLPSGLRAAFTQRCLKPGAAGWLRPRFKGVQCNSGRVIAGARALSDRIELELDNGPRTFDHVVLGTGYRVDLTRVGIFCSRLLMRIECVDGSPVLRAGFESSVPGLHFVGSSSVKSFGPLMRFVAGVGFAARAITSAALSQAASRETCDVRKAPLFVETASDLSPPR